MLVANFCKRTYLRSRYGVISKSCVWIGKKTFVISLSRKKCVLIFLYKQGNEPLRREGCVRDLGIYVDSTHSFNAHVSYLASSGLRLLGLFSRITRQFTEPTCIVRLYTSIIRSRLEFGSVVWNCLGVAGSERLEGVQRGLARIVYDRYYGRRVFLSHESMLLRMNLHTWAERRKFRDHVRLCAEIHGLEICASLLEYANSFSVTLTRD